MEAKLVSLFLYKHTKYTLRYSTEGKISNYLLISVAFRKIKNYSR